jgi:hypothetical protein
MTRGAPREKASRRLLLAAALAAVFALQTTWVVYSQTAVSTAKAPGALRTQRVQGDLHMISGEGGNVAVYATSEGVVLVDDMFDRNHADILAQVTLITDRPLRYVPTATCTRT